MKKVQASKIKVGVGFATGRKNFTKVLAYQFNNWKNSGIIDNPNISLNVYVAYDLEYNNLNKEAFLKIPNYIKEQLNSIEYIGKKEVHKICEKIEADTGIHQEALEDIFDSHGYGKLRNTILYTAIKEKNDYLLFLDDDEYPIVPIKKENGKIEWIEQEILKTHLEYIPDADITFGYHCGYISPIPYFDIENEAIFKPFIQAISNDIINWDVLKTLIIKEKGITYGDKKILEHKKVKEIPYTNGAKWVSGSNICLNLNRMKKIHPFYNPPNARGEDTFFSTCLKKEKVLKIPVYSFHDAFLNYTEILDNQVIKKLEAVSFQQKEAQDRFLKACIGWIRYKPLFIYITNKQHYEQSILNISNQLDISLDKIAKILNKKEFLEIKQQLEYYHLNVEKHYHQRTVINNTWKKII